MNEPNAADDPSEYPALQAQPPICKRCGGMRKRTGRLAHPTYSNLRIDLYRCETCRDRSEATIRVD